MEESSALQRFFLSTAGQRTDSAISKSNGLWKDYESSHIIPNRVNNIFSFYLANGNLCCFEIKFKPVFYDKIKRVGACPSSRIVSGFQ